MKLRINKAISVLIAFIIATVIITPESIKTNAAVSALWPVPWEYHTITTHFNPKRNTVNPENSEYHNAMDISAPAGTNIYAVYDGIVKFSGWKNSYGNFVVIYHPALKIYTFYAHASSLVATVNKEVKMGDVIAKVGNTGESYGNHLHFGICDTTDSAFWPRRTYYDPETYFTYSKNIAYTITLNANGGEVSPTSITVSGTYSGLPTPSKNGCAFAGWYTDPNGGENVWNGKALVTNGNHTLYAHWKKWYADLTPANLGNSFDAIILNKNCWKPIRPNSSSNVFLYKEEWITGEMWRFTRQSNGSYKIVNFSNGQCLDANGAGTTDGTNVGTYTSNDSNAQRWFIYEINGGYVLRAACGDLAMDLDGNKSADNTNIHLWTYHGGEAQVFSLYHSRGDSVVSDYAKPSPSAPTLSVKSYSSIALSWSATAYTEKYIVYRSTDNSTWKKIGETTSPSYTDTGLTAKTKYYYKFEAVNRFYTVSSPSASATTQAMPTYTVAFNSNGGSGTMSNQTITRDKATALTENKFSKVGYTFLGWSTDKNATKPAYTDKQSVTNLAAGGGTVTLYAVWQAKTINVTFHRNQNSGDTSTAKETFTYDVANQKFGYKTDGAGRYNPMNDASVGFGAWSKTGYSMLGWSQDKNATAKTYSTYSGVSNNWIDSNSPSIDLYAVWKANTYKVTLDYGSGKTTVIDVTYDSKYNVPAAEMDGYYFTGWYTKPNGEGTLISKDTTVKITAAQTLYACWKKEVLAITFNANGGTTELTEKLVSFDTKYGYLPDATKQGYEFGGWYLDEAFTQQITADSIVKITTPQEVYAKWTQVLPVITFDASGGTADMDTKQVVMGKNYGVLPDAVKEGCEFIGWFMEDGTEITPSSIVEVAEDTTVYAKWRVTGDVDADGDVDIDDVVMLQQWLLAVPDATLTNWRAGDLCQDERIDVFDLCLLKRLLIERNGEVE